MSNNSEDYLTFITQSNTSIHSLLDLIRQQDNNYYNLINLPPPAASYVPRSVSNLLPRSRRHSFHTRHERSNSAVLGSHRTSHISYPTIPSNENIVFTRNNDNTDTLLPRRANLIEENNDFQPSALEVLRSTDTKIFCEIEDPVNNICPISQEEFVSNQEVLQIKYCGHIFKTQSLLTWFINRSTCPYCRFDIRTFSFNNQSYNLNNSSNEINNPNSLSENYDNINISDNYTNPNTNDLPF